MSSIATRDADRLQRAFIGVVRGLGLLRPDTTPCGEPMSITEAHAVDELLRSGPSVQGELATALGLQKSTVSRLVGELEMRGLVTRTRNPADARSLHVALTPRGRQRAKKLAWARRDLFQSLIGAIDEHDRRTVIDGLTLLEEAARARC